MDALTNIQCAAYQYALDIDIGNMLGNAKNLLKTWGSAIIIILGVIMIIVAAVQIFRGLATQRGQQQANWVMTILLLFIGAAFALGGFNLLYQFGAAGRNTAEDLSGDTTIQASGLNGEGGASGNATPYNNDTAG